MISRSIPGKTFTARNSISLATDVSVYDASSLKMRPFTQKNQFKHVLVY